MFKLFFISAVIFSGAIVSIYSLSVPDINHGSIHFNDYRGKMILIVNTATGDSAASQQIVQLQQLYQQHQDSLVVIAFPSNSFGNEPGTDAEIKATMQNVYGVTFPIAAKSWVRGDSANIIHEWLGSKLQNDVMEARIKRDYQKFLIDRTGSIVGRFDSSVSPISTVIQNAIANN